MRCLNSILLLAHFSEECDAYGILNGSLVVHAKT